MENQDFDPIIVLKVKNNICCSAYVKKLKKKLAKLNVKSVEINLEKSLVSMRGKVDPNLVLDAVARTGKRAEIVHFDNKTPHNKHDPEQHHSRRQSCYNNRHEDEEEDYVKSSRRHDHGHFSYFQNRNRGEEEKEHHNCEYYDEPRMRSTRDHHGGPACGSSSFFGHFPGHEPRMRSTRDHHGGPPCESSSSFGHFPGHAGGPAPWGPPHWSMEDPPAWFGPRRPMEEPPWRPSEHGVGGEAHWPGFDYYGHHGGYENGGGCFIM